MDAYHEVLIDWQKLRIAKLAYVEISSAINKWNKFSEDTGISFSAHWDGCVTVDDTLFHEHELKD